MACTTHALRCLCDGRACCPILPKQLVTCRFPRFRRHRPRCCFRSLFHWTGTSTSWFEFLTEWKRCKRVRARGGGAWACLVVCTECHHCLNPLQRCDYQLGDTPSMGTRLPTQHNARIHIPRQRRHQKGGGPEREHRGRHCTHNVVLYRKPVQLRGRRRFVPVHPYT